MGGRLFDADPLSEQEEYFYFDDDRDEITIETRNDVEPLLDVNKRFFNDGTNGWTPSRDLKRIATIPPEIVLLWKERYGIDLFDKNHSAGVKRLLNDPEWLYLRTAPGCL